MEKLSKHIFITHEVVVSKDDKKVIIEHFQKEIELSLDYYNRVWNEGGQYIADLEILYPTF